MDDEQDDYIYGSTNQSTLHDSPPPASPASLRAIDGPAFEASASAAATAKPRLGRLRGDTAAILGLFDERDPDWLVF